MIDSNKWKQPAGCWAGFEEVPGRPGTCILRTHPLSRLLAETIMLILLWSCWAVIFDNSLKHSSNTNTLFGGVFGFVTEPVVVWGFGALLGVASIMALPQTLIVEADAPLFTYIIGFEHFGVRFLKPRSSVRGLLLLTRTWKGRSSTQTHVSWNGIGIPAMIAECGDYEIVRDYADYISTKTGIPRLSVDHQKKEETLRRLRSDGCLSVLFGIDIFWVWHSEGTVNPAYLTHAARHPSAALAFLGMSLVLFPIGIIDFILTALKLSRIRKQPLTLEDGRRADGTSIGARE